MTVKIEFSSNCGNKRTFGFSFPVHKSEFDVQKKKVMKFTSIISY